MTNEKMTIHQALCELKILDSRIGNEIRSGQFVGTTKHAAQKVGSQTVRDFSENAKASMDKINDLIARYNAIKKAVVLSNATTKVRVGDEEYSVAEAIAMKNHGMDYYKALYNAVSFQLNRADMNVKAENDTLEAKADSYVQSTYGNKDNKGNSAEIAQVRASYMEPLVVEIVDPVNAREFIKQLNDKFDTFSASVDSAISVSNAITEIEISY